MSSDERPHMDTGESDGDVDKAVRQPLTTPRGVSVSGSRGRKRGHRNRPQKGEREERDRKRAKVSKLMKQARAARHAEEEQSLEDGELADDGTMVDADSEAEESDPGLGDTSSPDGLEMISNAVTQAPKPDPVTDSRPGPIAHTAQASATDKGASKTVSGRGAKGTSAGRKPNPGDPMQLVQAALQSNDKGETGGDRLETGTQTLSYPSGRYFQVCQRRPHVERQTALAKKFAETMEELEETLKYTKKAGMDERVLGDSPKSVAFRRELGAKHKRADALTDEALALQLAIQDMAGDWCPQSRPMSKPVAGPVVSDGPPMAPPTCFLGPNALGTDPSPAMGSLSTATESVTGSESRVSSASLSLKHPPTLTQDRVFKRTAPLEGVKRFKGTLKSGDYVSVLSFLEKFDSMADQEGLDATTKALRLPEYLDDAALTWFNNSKQGWGSDYTAIQQALVSRFLTDGMAPDKWLATVKLNEGDDILAHNDQFTSMVRFAKTTLKKTLTEDEIAAKYLATLPEWLTQKSLGALGDSNSFDNYKERARVIWVHGKSGRKLPESRPTAVAAHVTLSNTQEQAKPPPSAHPEAPDPAPSAPPLSDLSSDAVMDTFKAMLNAVMKDKQDRRSPNRDRRDRSPRARPRSPARRPRSRSRSRDRRGANSRPWDRRPYGGGGGGPGWEPHRWNGPYGRGGMQNRDRFSNYGRGGYNN